MTLTSDSTAQLSYPLDQSTEAYIDCFTPVHFTSEGVRCIDQRALPVDEIYLTFRDWRAVAQCIKDMVVRGAPAIGITAAYGIALAARALRTERPNADAEEARGLLQEAREGLAQTRPTAVNLFWALERMAARWEEAIQESAGVSSAEAPALTDLIVSSCDQEALAIHREDIEMCRAMGDHGAQLLTQRLKGAPARLLTHCNTGALATGGHGTALGVIRSAWERGELGHVYADETRPFLQGSRLTAWELHRDEIPVEVICEGMAAHLMSRGLIDAVFVGADRIAANGDAANKIGTYGLAIAAAAHEIPFYIVAPTSTVDLDTPTGAEIPIEQRDPSEVTHCGGRQIVPTGVGVQNPAFDVTPAKYITAIITEQGVISSDQFALGLKEHVTHAHQSSSAH